MEVEEIQTQAPPSKFPRIDLDSLKVRQNYPLEEDDLKLTRMTSGGAAADNGTNRLRGWHHSRIIRVSRASGGKDRHSKVLTSKGLRDRRVRLSVSTAIQFYDIQDRLGYDQPSKAVEWLIKAASEAIAELPSLNTFPDTSKQLSDEKKISEGNEHGFDSADVELEDDLNYQNPNQQQQQQQHVSLSKSAYSSTSETSKGSGLSLSRSEIRANRVKKSRERARKRTAKEKKDPPPLQAHQGGDCASATLAPPISQSPSFTELLTAGITSNSNSNPSGSAHQPNTASRQWALSSPMDYFSTGQLLSRAQNLPGFLGQIQLPQAMPNQVPPFSVSGEGNNNNNNHHQELQHISFVNAEQLNLIPVTSSTGGEYNLNFTISPSSVSSSSSSTGLIAGFNWGTLQSNLPHLQRFTSPHHHVDGSTNNLPFVIGAAAVSSPVETSHHHHHHQLQQLHIGQFSSGIDDRLQLCYGDGNQQGTDHKGKGAKS